MSPLEELMARLEKASPNEKPDLLNDLGEQIHYSDPEKTEQYCRQALAQAESLGLTKTTARSCFLIGLSSYVRGLHDQAQENFSRAVEFYESIGDKGGVAAALRYLGMIKWNGLDSNTALEYHLKATALREELGDKPGIAECYNDIAYIYWNGREFEKAMAFMQKSVPLFAEVGDRHHVSMAYNRIGVVLTSQHKSQDALEYLDKAYKIREELDGTSGLYMAGVIGAMGDAYMDLKNYPLALEYYGKALQIGINCDYKEVIIIANLHMGDAHAQMGNYERALPMLKKAFRVSREAGLKPREFESCQRIADLYEKIGCFKDALRYEKLYATLREASFDEQKNKQIAEMQARFESEQSRKEAEIYRLKNVDLLREITERQRAEDELTNYKNHLEELVKERTGELEGALDEVERLKNQLQAENIYLQEEIRLEHNFEEIIGRSENLNRALMKVERVADTNATVLITGESGTGKELVARAIHSISRRKDRPLVKVNCAALPVNLIESELFGHERGAFSGAVSRKIGRFELASGGTILLDEISELPLESQAKLLRVLQEGELERLGDTKSIKIDVRVIAITNRNLEIQVKEGKFRDDLFYRLNVFPIELPPLRERREDIPILAAFFNEKESRSLGRGVKRIPQQVIDQFLAYSWPGNIRELKNIIERSILISQNKNLELETIFLKKIEMALPEGILPMLEMEKAHIIKALNSTGWRVSGPRGAAILLDMNPNTLVTRMRKLGIKRKISEG